jgi:hypothetical protein
MTRKGPIVYLKIEPRRRKAIVEAYVGLKHGVSKTEEIIYYVRKQCGFASVSQFMDNATDLQINKLERLLKDV